MKKSTHLDLAEELTKRNTKGRYDELIRKAKAFYYHDYKSPAESPTPKLQLVTDLEVFPELSDIRDQVMSGSFDEEADEQDKQMLRETLPQSMWRMFDL